MLIQFELSATRHRSGEELEDHRDHRFPPSLMLNKKTNGLGRDTMKLTGF